jgi:hypothetical protein
MSILSSSSSVSNTSAKSEIMQNINLNNSIEFNEQTFSNWISLFGDENSNDELMLKSIQDLNLNLEVYSSLKFFKFIFDFANFIFIF